MNFLDLDIQLEDMTASEKKLADFISKNLTRLSYLTEKEISEELEVSTATISRFWRKLGFASNKDFKSYLKKKMVTTPANKLEDILKKTEKDGLLGEMFKLAANYLKETMNHLSFEQFQKAVFALGGAQTVYLFGPGPCSCVVDLLEFRLNRLGLNIKKMPASGPEIFESMVNITDKDVLVIFGFVHMLREIKVLLDFAGKKGCTTILITDLLASEMIEMSDIILYTTRGELWEFHSMVAPLVLIETLVVGVSKEDERKSLARLTDLHRLRKNYESYLPRY